MTAQEQQIMGFYEVNPPRLPELEQNSLPDLPQHTSIDDRWRAFHAANPHVYRAIVSVARDLKHKGWRRAGMKQIFEHLRWKYAIATKGDQWRLNNDFTSIYSSQVMTREPDLAGFFEIRDRKGNKQ